MKQGHAVLGIGSCKLIRRIRFMCFQQVFHMEVGRFDESERFNIMIAFRISADAVAVRALVGYALTQMVQDISSAHMFIYCF